MEYIKLTAQMEMHIDLMHAIGLVFDSSMRKFVPRIITKQSHSAEKKFLEFSENYDYLAPAEERPHCNQIVKEIIVQLFTSKLIQKILSYIKQKTTSPQCFAEFINIYSGIESSLSLQVVSILLPIIIGETIRLLDETKTDFSGMCHFLSSRFKANEKQAGEIIEVLCRMSEVGKTTIRSGVVSEIIEISNDRENQKLIKENSELIKKTFIEAISLNQNAIILKQIYTFFPKFAEICVFTTEDLKEIISRSNGSCPSEMLVKMIPTLADGNNLDSFAQFLIKNSYFSPELFSLLMSKVKKSIATKLLDYILKNPEQLKKDGLEGFKMTKTIQEYIVDVQATTPDIVESLSLFYLKAPTLEEFSQFIMETVQMFEDAPQLINVLNSFSSVMDKFDSTQTIIDVFDLVFSSIEQHGSASPHLPLIPVLADWISAKKTDIPVNEFIERFKRLDYTNCPSIIPAFFNTIVSRQENIEQEPVIDLLSDIVVRTVNRKNARWAVWELFSRIQDDKAKVEQICDDLLKNDNIQNVAHMVYEACLYEADFIRSSEQFLVQQKVHIREFDKDLVISFSPLHSSRRLYFEVSKAIDKKIDEFLLWTYDAAGEFVIPYGCSLTSYNINSQDVLVLSVQKDIANGAPESVPHGFFLTHIMESSDYMMQLIDMMERTSSVHMFQVLKLLQRDSFTDSFVADHSDRLTGNSLVSLFFDRVSDVSEFHESMFLFPYAIESYLRSMSERGEHDDKEIESICNTLATKHYDSISFAIATDSLTRFCSGKEIHFSKESILKCLIEAEDQRLRKSILTFIKRDTPMEDLIQLISAATRLENRSKTRQFFEFLRDFDVNKQVAFDFFRDLQQFEFSAVWDVDETYIGLIKLIPVTNETIRLVINHLFTLPTVRNCMNPFLQTIESRGAAFEFLTNEQALTMIDALLAILTSTPTSNQSFSDDFTPKGRQGITNLGSTCYINAVLQNLVAMTNLAAPILSLESSSLSPFMLQLRNSLALIKYGRGRPISITDFAQTLPDFRPNVQEDAEEFFNMVINRVVDEMKSPVIDDQICGKIRWEICDLSNGSIISTKEDDFYYISLWTKGLHTVHEGFCKYFEDSEISGGYEKEKGERVPAVRRVRVSKWPNYLVLQLQRWDYSLDTMERKKLMQELQFPVDLKPPFCDDRYILSGVIIHDGDAESGHYTAITRNETGNDWYFCNDHEIRNFDPSLLGQWCYGSEPRPEGEQVWTGYLLFYQRSTLVHAHATVPGDLQELVDQYNGKNWLSSCLYSNQFVRFIEDIANLNGEMSPLKSQIIFTTFFRIVLVNDDALSRWSDFLAKNVLGSKDSCVLFFKYLDTCIGQNLPTILSISDIVADKMQVIIRKALTTLNDTTKPLLVLFGNNTSEYGMHKRAISFAFDIIGFVSEKLRVDWTQEPTALSLLCTLLTMEMSREVQRNTARQQYGAYISLTGIMSSVAKSPSCSDAILTFLDIGTLNRNIKALRKSDDFASFLIALSNTRPDLLQHLVEADAQVQNLVNSVIPIPLGGANEIALDVDLAFYFKRCEQLIFHDKESIRKKTLETLVSLVGPVPPHIEEFFKERPYDEKRARPDFSTESSFVHFLLQMTKKLEDLLVKGKIANTEEYIALLKHIVSVAPLSTSSVFPSLIHTAVFALSSLRDQKQIAHTKPILASFVTILHHLIAYDVSLFETLSEATVSTIRGISEPSIMLVEVVITVPQVFSGSCLLSKCIEFVMEQKEEPDALRQICAIIEDDTIQKLHVQIPSAPKGWWVLRLANLMWNTSFVDRNELCEFMLKALRIVPFKLFRNIKSVAQTVDLISSYSPESLNEFTC